MRVVIDTNCLILSIPKHREEFWLYLAFRDEAFTWLISNEIMMEYVEILASFYSLKTAEVVANTLLSARNVTLKEADYKWNLITDPDDNKFTDLAISGNVHYLVTNDKHFDILKTLDFPPVKVVDLETFRQILGY
jgi:uncharacterized protein